MNRRDRKLWATARTLADIGELTALWLEGRIKSQPGYADGCGPDPETAELIPVLAACNRAGFVTNCSQPGTPLTGEGWEQRAAVEGFASPEIADRLASVLAVRGAWLFRAQDAALRMSYKEAIPVTRWDGDAYTRFGVRLSRRFIRDPWEGYGCTGATVTLCEARQVTIADPDWGRNDRLWPVLAEFAGLVVAS